MITGLAVLSAVIWAVVALGRDIEIIETDIDTLGGI
jgi:hypothetical protein